MREFWQTICCTEKRVSKILNVSIFELPHFCARFCWICFRIFSRKCSVLALISLCKMIWIWIFHDESILGKIFCAENRLSKILNLPILGCCVIVRVCDRFLVLHFEKVFLFCCVFRAK